MWIYSPPCSIYNHFMAQLKKKEPLGRSNDFVFVKTKRPDFFKGHLCFVTLLNRLSNILGFFEE